MQKDFCTADHKHSVALRMDTQWCLMKQQKPHYQNKQSNKIERGEEKEKKKNGSRNISSLC